MIVTIIPIDKTVIVDGVGYHDVDMTDVSDKIHAIQWGGKSGTIEYKNGNTDYISDIKKYEKLISKCTITNIRKANKPGGDYYVWDDTKGDWVEDPILKRKLFKPFGLYLVWNDTKGDWVEDPILKRKSEVPIEPYFFWDEESSDWVIDKKSKSICDLIATIKSSKLYLENTDFYYARKLETGQDVPKDVATKRISDREYIKNNDTSELRSEYEIILSAKNI
jgi:hypothetical protein